MKSVYFWQFLILLTLCLLAGCDSKKQAESTPAKATSDWGKEQLVEIVDYNKDAKDPQVSANEEFLFFSDGLGEIHYAQKISPTKYQHKGKLGGLLPGSVTPAIDPNMNFYFVTKAGIYGGKFDLKGSISGVAELGKKLITPDPITGVDVTNDGNWFFVSRKSGTIGLAMKSQDGFTSYPNGDLFKNIGRSFYSTAITNNGLELYFTTPFESGTKIMLSKRPIVNDIFGVPQEIPSIQGDAGAPCLSADEKHLYFHKKVGAFKVFRVSK